MFISLIKKELINKLKTKRFQIKNRKKGLFVDLSYIDHIRKAKLEDLSNSDFLQNQLLPKIGLNNEKLDEFPEELYPFCGYGLLYWQYPNQFSKYLVTLSKLKIESYLEIGVRHGGTFIITVEYLKRFNKLKEAIGIDILPFEGLSEYEKSNPKITYIQTDSLSCKFKDLLKTKKQLDLVLIDGLHEEHACRSDFQNVKDKANIVVFHDIASDVCPAVANVWKNIKNTYADKYCFIEFIQQYKSVQKRTDMSFLGIGMAIKKEYIKENKIDI